MPAGNRSSPTTHFQDCLADRHLHGERPGIDNNKVSGIDVSTIFHRLFVFPSQVMIPGDKLRIATQARSLGEDHPNYTTSQPGADLLLPYLRAGHRAAMNPSHISKASLIQGAILHIHPQDNAVGDHRQTDEA